jgi:hypothetical protein
MVLENRALAIVILVTLPTTSQFADEFERSIDFNSFLLNEIYRLDLMNREVYSFYRRSNLLS